MGARTTVQILLIIVSIVVIMTYIRPTFATMQETQNETKEYKGALDNAARFNAELERLVNTANSFSTTERRAIDRYLPPEVDMIGVMRDIETIIGNNRMQLSALQSEEAQANRNFRSAQGQTTDDSPKLNTETFLIQVTGTYDQFKSLLQDFERNAYPLEATVINFTTTENSNELYLFNMTLETYAFGTSNETE